MIDFEAMNRRQQEGLTDIDSLQEDEKMVLQHYCSLATEALLKMGLQRKAPVDQVVVNAFRLGIALGFHLTVAAGEVRER